MEGSRRINRPLTNLSVRYSNENYIAEKALGSMPVAHESDVYYVYGNENLRLDQTARANGAPANMATFAVSSTSYSLTEHALKDVITKRDRENVDVPLSIDRDVTEYLTDKIQLRLEQLAATLLFTTTSWGNNATLNTATSWNYNTTTSAPIQNVLSATTLIVQNGGGKANTIIVSRSVCDSLKNNTNI